MQADALVTLGGLATDSVDLVLTDPPYFRVVADDWDNQWTDDQHFLHWMGTILDELRRVMKPTGSLYLFASPRLAAHVEVAVAERFHVLNAITWTKATGSHMKASPRTQRRWLSPWERIIFAESEAAEAREDTAARTFAEVAAPLWDYLRHEMARADVALGDAMEALGFPHDSYFGKQRWALPSEDKYLELRAYLGAMSPTDEFLQRPYNALTEEFEALWVQSQEERYGPYGRRRFAVERNGVRSDVWNDFPAPRSGRSGHPTEKPIDLLAHIIQASSREDDLVVDPFSGSGSTAEAALSLRRRFWGGDLSPVWARATAERVVMLG